ncbi:MAG: DNA polymerase III subunit alpha [Gammaproteobacteria bacterium]|jgi:DNA polymerase-3 subunit alpha|nr:DNA polymerase III subunit alpha [Gammaproteobacteria bacterium]MBT3490120.1 DNA polymerase III subunit alpha [Gammaproteobacteria bacterium]MBT3718610.1 DNA polymerase III subunit alpha [Gammaproteobacteria bacterium]MBT3844396.1 DNA polymerase III subunit alpha [Gammaproteobacteria bacterium]MBT3892593.1 DNA polymerase III subunit alpha [Gammaproteobacteria bacterium]
MSFVHLRTHTEYSLENGLIRIEKKKQPSPLMTAVQEGEMSAVAVTDLGNLFSAVKFYRAATGSGIKPIFGSEVRIHPEEESGLESRLVLLAQNSDGFKNIKTLLSRSFIEGQRRGVPQIDRDWFKGLTAGVIALSGGRSGDIGQALLDGEQEEAEQHLQAWVALFPGRFYLELQRTERSGDENWNHGAVALAEQYQLPVVATNDVHFLKADEFDAHEARVCIHDGRVLDDPRRPKHFTADQYLKSAAEMAALFEDLPEAIENSVQIARRCNVELSLGKNYLPEFPIPEGLTIEQFFQKESEEGLEQRLIQLFETPELIAGKRAPYDERLKIELEVINGMGFPGYFLIVADFIRWSKEKGIPVGPGRGSGAGSLVAYALLITDLDPLEYELLFERFLNPERVSMPDFDVDFCMDRRDEVIRYVAETYGIDRVSQIITYGRMNAKAVIRDVGRVQGHPYGMVDRIAKLIPFDLGMTLDKALAETDELKERYDEEDDVRELVDLARSLEGVARNAGKHAGGVVISPSDINDFSPIYCEENGSGLVTQFDKDDVEAVGLVKFDFLGLRTLTIIDWAIEMIDVQRKLQGEQPLDITKISLQDKSAFELLQAAQTTAVFQLESSGMKELIVKLKPDCFEDIIALVALYRPGPLESGMVDNFIDRKHGREELSYPDAKYQHESLIPILQPTYGVILYQEQVMQIAQVLSGYSLGGADMLRRAMGKKKPEEMEKQRSIFAEGAKNNQIDPVLAMKIFDLVEKFAGYGFNKSHSAAYALVSYQTAWLKSHYPAPFMAAVLSADMDNTDKVVTLIEECRSMGLVVHPPGINRSRYKFTVLKQNDSEKYDVVYGIGAIKGVGEAAIEGIIAEREESGNYKDLFDFCRRIDLRKANKRVMESLIRAGALDEIAPPLEGQPAWESRATLMVSLPDAMQAAEQHVRDQERGQADLFGGCDESEPAVVVSYQQAKPWSEDERLIGERNTLGLYLTGHPIDQHEEELSHIITQRMNRLSSDKDKMVTLSGLLVSMRVVKTRTGKPLAILVLDDRTGRLEMTLFAETYEKYRHLLEKDAILVVQGTVTDDDYTGGLRMNTEELWNLDGARAAYMKRLTLKLEQSQLQGSGVEALQTVIKPFCEGHIPVRIHYRQPQAIAQLDMGSEWNVQPSSALFQRLREQLGDEAVETDYG